VYDRDEKRKGANERDLPIYTLGLLLIASHREFDIGTHCRGCGAL